MKSWTNRGMFCTFVVATMASYALAVDTDLDGVDDQFDVCCSTPSSTTVDFTGRPVGDLDQDCDVDLDDVSLLWAGFTGPLTPQTSCEEGGPDEDECFLGLDNCSQNATCTNTPGGFLCTCLPGFSGNGIICNDINECAQNVCGQGGVCTNYPGFYECNCAPGYSEVNGTCQDVDECEDTGLCGDAGVCTNEPGQYSCICNDGYANCDSEVDCEVQLANFANSCSTAQFVGQTCGDFESTPACTPTTFETFSSTSGRGSMWLKARIDECSACCSDLQHRYTLNVPLGTDYDLYVYSACNGGLLDYSIGDIDQTETVTPTLHDDCGPKDNSGYVYIEIRHYAGSSCGSWELILEGHE